MTRDPERTALKEWSVLCEAMGHGEIIAMVRKGGIREQRAGFTVRHDRFLLYPTFFHEKVGELASRFAGALTMAHANRPPEGRLRLELFAEVESVWRVTELDRLRAIEGAHGLAWDAVRSRFHYRDNPVVQVVAIRVRRLHEIAEVPDVRRYAGCVSWVELDDAVDVAGSVPVLPAGELQQRLAVLRNALGQPER